jgi:hypothetical protein
MNALRVTARQVGRQTQEGAWDFTWGEVNSHVPDTSEMQQHASTLIADISTEAVPLVTKSGTSVGLTADMVAAAKPSKSSTEPRSSTEPDQKTPLTQEALETFAAAKFQQPDDAVSLAESLCSGPVSSLSSGEGAEQVAQLSEDCNIALAATILAGSERGKYVHLCNGDYSEADTRIKCRCGTSLGRNGTAIEVAGLFKVGSKQPCPQCLPHMDPILLRELW